MARPQPTLYTDEAKVTDMTSAEVISGKQYLPDPEIERVADKVIEEMNLELGPVEIEYMSVHPNISKSTAAKTIKAAPLVRYYSGNTHIVQISGDLWDMLDEDTRFILVFHQLMKVDARFKAKEQEWVFGIRKPDFADFYKINDKYGNEWYKTIQATVSSLHDMEPRQERGVKV